MKRENQTLLVGVDFGEESERALAQAVEMAAMLQASLEVVHVNDQPMAMASGDYAGEPTLQARLSQANHESALRERNTCIEMCERIISDRAEWRVHTYAGAVIDTMLMAIHVLKPAFVVVGSHGRGALKRLIMGSVSAAICQRSPVPVVVVPSAAQVRRAEAFGNKEIAAAVGTATVSADATVASCAACGHIQKDLSESTHRCSQCGAAPAQWYAAPMTGETIDPSDPTDGNSVV